MMVKLSKTLSWIFYLEAPIPSGTNYVNAEQNSEEWHTTRNKKNNWIKTWIFD